ncbi:hypothetical protein HHI36_023920 [Cryptolaemus montrouzieri]|uniref:Uncharacterized protein n=1 Tax=Cryptolaemus montrouzieri TaxID=559131 RepID=A0ABD2NYK5_9CUCU
MTYLSGRIFRLKLETPDDIVLKHQLRTRLLELEGEFAERMEPKDEDPLLNNIPASQSTPLRSSNNFSGNLSIKKVPVFKWGLKKFNGRGSLIQFLELIDSLKVSRGCTDVDLFEAATDLFEGDAWVFWHNSHLKNKFADWTELVDSLKQVFLPDNYDLNLLEDIKSRKQYVREHVSIFISSMEAQFNRLNRPVPENDIVNIIRNNLLFDYVKALLVLHDIDDLAQLTSLCKRRLFTFAQGI